MNISETPKVRYYEADSNPTLTGDGAQIPVFIGYTGNTSPKEGILKFKNYTACNKTPEYGGIKHTTTDDETSTANPLLEVLNDFFTEVRKTDSSDVTVPYVYVIDMGTATADTADVWTKAMDTAKTRREAQVEVYVFKEGDTQNNIVSILATAKENIVKDSEHGNPRIAYFTILGASDDTLKTVADDTLTDAVTINESRVALAEPTYFGRIIGRICTTPYYIEPGYYDMRSVDAEIFNNRTEDEMNELQSSGVIFIADELAGSEIHPRINLAVSTAFATNEDNRPNDCLLHSRRNVDQLIREVFVILYEQLKRNETETNLSYLQSDIDVVLEDKFDAGYIMEGSEINVVESETNPYDLKVEGAIKPVNATYLIGFSLYVEAPNTMVTTSTTDNEED